MSTGTPYIGSKISLISKAEIRYEGILYAVDTKEATVTLAKVRSFGTEDRAVPKHIPPRNETYEFIIFRGSDIKDLHVSEFPKLAEAPQDPAILSAQSVPPLTSNSQSPPTHTHASPHTHPPPPNPPYNPFPPPAMGGYSPFGMPYFRPPMMMSGPGHPHPHPHPSPPNPPHSSHAPVPVSQPLPTMHPVPHHPSTHPPPPSHTFTPPPPRPVMTVPPPPIPLTPPAYMVPREKPQASSTPQTSSKSSELPIDAMSTQTIAKSSPPEAKNSIIPPPQSQPPPSQTVQPKAEHPPRPPSPTQPLSQAPPAEPSEPMVQQKQSPPEVTSAPPQGNGHKDATEPSSEDPLMNTAVTQKRRQPNSHRPGAQGTHSRGYRGRKDNHYRGGPPRGGGRGGNYSSQPTYRYDSEFDFESANARFNKDNLEEEFKQKVKVEDGGVVEGERRASENSPPETLPPPEEEEGRENDMLENGSREGEFYDKSKSFFDNISCELNTASNDRRPRWSKERELNTETFGVSSVYSRGYRGRRGGWRGGWRGRGGYGGRGGQRGGNRYYGNQREYGGYGQQWGGRGGGGSGRGYHRGGNSRRRNYAATEAEK